MLISQFYLLNILSAINYGNQGELDLQAYLSIIGIKQKDGIHEKIRKMPD